MKSKGLGLLAAALMGVSGVVGAAVLEGSATDPTGIDGLVVLGTTYNVSFSTTTLNSFTQGSTLSVDAANALSTALVSLGVTALRNGPLELNGYFLAVDATLDNTDGPRCYTNVTLGGCSSPWGAAYALSSLSLGQTLCGTGSDLTCYVEAADFAPVPVPAAIWLILSGLAGLGLTGWRRGQTAAA